MNDTTSSEHAASAEEAVTPEQVLAAVQTLLAQARADEQRVPLYAVVNQLLDELGYEQVSRAQVAPPLRRAILRAIRQLPDLGCSGGG